MQRKRTPLKIGSRIVAACISNGDTQSHTNETVWNLNCYNRIKYNANPQMFGSKLYFDSMFCWYLCGVRAKKKRFTGKRAATIQKTCNQISTFPFFLRLTRSNLSQMNYEMVNLSERLACKCFMLMQRQTQTQTSSFIWTNKDAQIIGKAANLNDLPDWNVQFEEASRFLVTENNSKNFDNSGFYETFMQWRD